MALDASVGTPTANSYVLVTEADSYFEDRLHSTLWVDLVDKDDALVTASRMLDWFSKWKGTKALTSQSMEWPRTAVVRASGEEVSSLIIPEELKVAVYELALSSISGDRVSNNDLAGLSEVKAGPLTVKTVAGSFDPTKRQSIPSHIWNILSDIITQGKMSVVRLMRA